MFKINRSTVYRTIKRFSERNNFESRPKKGRPGALDAHEERQLIHLARRFPKVSRRALAHLDGMRVSTSTVKRIMRRHHLTKWRARKRPLLTPEAARKRRELCRFWRGREVELVRVRALDEAFQTSG